MIMNDILICAEKLENGPYEWEDTFIIRQMVFEMYKDYTKRYEGDYIPFTNRRNLVGLFNRYDFETLARCILTHINPEMPLNECYRIMNEKICHIHNYTNFSFNVRVGQVKTMIDASKEYYERLNAVIPGELFTDDYFNYYYVPEYLAKYLEDAKSMSILASSQHNLFTSNKQKLENMKKAFKLYKKACDEQIESDIAKDRCPFVCKSALMSTYATARRNLRIDFGYVIGTLKNYSTRAEAFNVASGHAVNKHDVDKEECQILFSTCGK